MATGEDKAWRIGNLPFKNLKQNSSFFECGEYEYIMANYEQSEKKLTLTGFTAMPVSSQGLDLAYTKPQNLEIEDIKAWTQFRSIEDKHQLSFLAYVDEDNYLKFGRIIFTQNFTDLKELKIYHRWPKQKLEMEIIDLHC